MDLVRELRLRQWARQHYVPVEQRQAEWHHIVLQEMQLRDQEIGAVPASEVAPAIEAALDTIVSNHEHVREPIPFEATQIIDAEESVEIEFVQHPWGWTFLPAVLGRYQMLHEGSSDIPRPHARAFFGNVLERDEAPYLFMMD